MTEIRGSHTGHRPVTDFQKPEPNLNRAPFQSRDRGSLQTDVGATKWVARSGCRAGRARAGGKSPEGRSIRFSCLHDPRYPDRRGRRDNWKPRFIGRLPCPVHIALLICVSQTRTHEVDSNHGRPRADLGPARSRWCMDRPASRPSGPSSLLVGSLLTAVLFAVVAGAQAQTSGASGSTNPQSWAATPAGASRRGSNPAKEPGRNAGQPQPRNEPSQAYRESIRRTVEKRRQRRASRGQGTDDSRPVGAIVPWIMPPVLIIRHTPQVHDEIDSLLGFLRK